MNIKTLTSSNRNEVVECGRFLAAASIVWLHTVGAAGCVSLEYSARFDRWAVPFFIAASLWFANPITECKSPLFYFKCRFLRLYPVFLIWNIIYLTYRVFSGFFFHSSLQMDLISFAKQLLFDGFAHHLWFLTFLVLVDIAITILAIIRIPSLIIYSILALGLVLMSYLPSSFYPTFGSYLMVMSWWSLPSVILFTLCKPIIRNIITERNNSYFLSFALLIIGLIATGVSLNGNRNAVLEAASGVFLFFGFLSLGNRKKLNLFPLLRWFTSMSAGIYLVHVLFVQGFKHILNALGYPLQSFEIALKIFLLSMIFSILSVALLSKYGPDILFNGIKRKSRSIK